MGKLLSIKLDEIRPNPVALRAVNRQADSFRELIDSIKANGVMNAIVVREKPGEDGKKYELIDGLHRFSSSQEAGLTEIPANILEKNDAEALIAQIIGNVQKVETKPAEYAKGLMRILSHNPTMTEAQLATMLSKSPAWIGDQLGLTRLEDNVSKLVNEGKIPLSNAYPLSKLPKQDQMDWLERAMTLTPAEFGPKVSARVKEIRDANRKGKAAGEEQFVPVPHLRNKKELEEEMRNPKAVPALLRTQKVKTVDEASRLALQWAMNFDPESQAAQKAKHDEHMKHQAEQKARRQAEQAEKRAKEASEKEAQLRKEADAARAKAPEPAKV
jgi:ParB/RepB/Spo0J family partition protein